MVATTDKRQSDTITAVVVNYNGGERVLKCLRALAAQTADLQGVVVVDNKSTDGSDAAIQASFPQVRVVRLPANLGLPVARNEGLKRVKTKLVLLIDNDVYVADECLQRLREAQARSGAAVVCPRVILHPDDRTVQCDGGAAHFVGTQYLNNAYRPLETAVPVSGPVDTCVGACLLVDRERVLAAGGFESLYFFYFEDLEFSMRMRTLGHEILCEPQARVFHDRGEGIAGLSFRGAGTYPERRAYLTMRNRLLTILIHYRFRTMVVLLPALLAYELATLASVLARGWLKPYGRAWIWLLAHVRDIRERRRRIQLERVRPDAELLSGQELPFAPGFLQSRAARVAVSLLSALLSRYWRLVRPLVG